MSYKLGFLGCGNMAGAILGGLIKSGLYKGNEIIISDIDKEKTQNMREKFSVNIAKDNDELFEKSEAVLLAVKPQFLQDALKDVNKENFKDKFIISIVAGTPSEKIKSLTDKSVKISRIMPNTPALVNEAMSAVCFDENLDAEKKSMVIDMFSSIGKVIQTDESMLDAVTAVSGSGPAYAFLMLEAMADAGVLLGLQRDQAYTLAAQTMLGSAKMYLETKKHPGELKDMVCSPKGTTIEAVRQLEKNGFRSALEEAMVACYEKSKLLGK